MTERYKGQRVALLTQHGKEQVLAPILEPALGCTIVRVDDFDTDQLGTFTRERSRPGSQIEAARRKARIGMDLSGLPVGLASEGSFGPDPFSGFLSWNVELLVWIDDQLGIEVIGIAQGASMVTHFLTGDLREAGSFAARLGFPAQRLVLRPEGEEDARFEKGIADWPAFESAFARCRDAAGNRRVFIEPDLRAFGCPERLERIAVAARDLLGHLRSACPHCSLPGFAVIGRESGLRCSSCGLPTQVWCAARWRCQGCGFESMFARTDRERAEPRECVYCNP